MGANRLVLWDIDHTLIETGGVGREVFAAAFHAVTGTPMVRMTTAAGKTELAFFRETLELHGLSPARFSFARFARLMACGYHERSHDLLACGRVLPGAVGALRALARVPGIAQSVLTGNARPTTEAKLKIFGLDRHVDLDIGAYGDDDAVRAALVPIAQRRAGRKLGQAFSRDSTLLIGDTPADVIAGRDGGARVIAVASGESGLADLKEAGADVVLRDLTDTGALLDAIHTLLPTSA
ncbi:haloacid dehalogenase [Thermopolyspora flexuosa]|uniref:Phosphoglycolate phosphatase-like HAD superfamily hydrolase n=1 Tax=Thermopolyspora flexuosa TaxID=103836 RepID=A0A543J425_9ACTN|nr:HAD family hydrolase [Thermopolyspora flexuosa]TQM77577.1 phosphoglycolate phosphatase-like HAD superfamily hydrolase [Thermopolyspora flexuosa]GGM72348.1 haloacid dehalogenase [Thermopolyspora flexuosa]